MVSLKVSAQYFASFFIYPGRSSLTCLAQTPKTRSSVVNVLLSLIKSASNIRLDHVKKLFTP